MKIIFTNSIFYLQKKGGISRYYINLSRELSKLRIKHKIIAPFSKNYYLKNLKDNNFSFYIKKFPINFIFKKINYILFKYFLKKENPDIIHETYYNSDNLNILKGKINVVTVYDLVHEKFSKFYQKEKKFEKQKILNSADHFICISKKTQYDFVKYYKISPKKTSVIYLGCDHFKKNRIKNHNLNLPKNFFLYVGSRDGYKNFELLVKAIKILNIDPMIKVVCFGGGKFSNLELDRYKLKDNFINIQGGDKLLSFLYSKAFALINTSKYEGFGITNIEAMQLGCPVISSDFRTLKEIGANSCLFFKNNNYVDLAKKLKIFIFKEKIRKKFIQKGYLRSKNFTWASCAKKTKKLYEDLAK
ncbi:glycosyltransferase family 4 protein [Candidatus Pelagibacter sp.]|nr:glycosyltransferase family 4 protein [Candidatus Pelagibacter sp.]